MAWRWNLVGPRIKVWYALLYYASYTIDQLPRRWGGVLLYNGLYPPTSSSPQQRQSLNPHSSAHQQLNVYHPQSHSLYALHISIHFKMSFKLAFVASLVFLAVTCVRAGIPVPQAPGGPRSQCGIWRSALQANGMPATANRVNISFIQSSSPSRSLIIGRVFLSSFFFTSQLTASHTSALKQTMIKRSTLEARRIPGHIPVSFDDLCF